MINITCSNGITTVVNTDYNVMPVVKFVNSVGSYISEARGMYNGHYYWALDGVASYGNLPGVGTVYIWFNTGDTEWWATDTLGGGLFYDTIQSPTNTLYPLEAFVGGSFDGSILISPANGLAKSYFNINGKFHTKETTFYVYLANDVYEIPLAKLQVNGSSQATMQDGINALAAILVNAGAGTTITPPFTDAGVSLSSEDYTASLPGTYRVINGGISSYAINFGADATTYAGYTITIINADEANNAPLGSGSIVEIDGGGIAYVPSNSAYIFVAINNSWILISSRTI